MIFRSVLNYVYHHTFKLCGLLVLWRFSISLICLGNFLRTNVNKPFLATFGPLTPDFRRYFKVFQGTLDVFGVWYNIGQSSDKYKNRKLYLLVFYLKCTKSNICVGDFITNISLCVFPCKKWKIRSLNIVYSTVKYRFFWKKYLDLGQTLDFSTSWLNYLKWLKTLCFLLFRVDEGNFMPLPPE